MNENFVKGKWLEMKGEIRKAWGNLTDDELEKTKGDVTAIGGLIRQRYGEKEETYRDKLSGIMNKFKAEKDEAVDKLKDKFRKTP